MSLEARLLKVQTVQQGDCVGYGSRWCAPRATQLGLVACGYADGYPRVVSAAARAVLNGRRLPIVGRVSMDSLSLDLGPDSSAKPGDVVQLWGDQLSADEVAAWAGTIAYELFCKVTARPQRIYQ